MHPYIFCIWISSVLISRTPCFSVDLKVNRINQSDTVCSRLESNHWTPWNYSRVTQKYDFNISYVIQIVTFDWTIFGTILAFFMHRKKNKVMVLKMFKKGSGKDGLVWTQSPLSFREGRSYITDPLCKRGGGHIQNCYN